MIQVAAAKELRLPIEKEKIFFLMINITRNTRLKNLNLELSVILLIINYLKLRDETRCHLSNTI